MAKQTWNIPTKTVYLDLDDMEYDTPGEARSANETIKSDFLTKKVREKLVQQIVDINDDPCGPYDVASIVLSGSINIKQAKIEAEEDFKAHYNLS